ncbi:MAG TPA: Holliday junction branch migration protein RuvA [Jiangellaceae bacterium]|jgi:Holliday junction DNA helicase RuvA|nr:Holliday junction branch migration protein RuvA [Jiangellaceae bacterium]
MIAFIRGRVAAARAGEVVIDVGGIGLVLQCTPSTAAALRVGDDAQVPSCLIVREESLTLFGFADDDERHVFELLQTASGIGPRLAQAMLAVHTPDDLRRAVATEDLVSLTRVPGIGKKGAQRIVVELADKLGPPAGQVARTASSDRSGPADGWQGQVHSALLGLGWTGREVESAIEQVSPLVGDGVDAADVSALLKAALRTLARP